MSLSNYIFSKKIDVSKFTNKDSHFISLREPSVREYKEIVKLVKKIESKNEYENIVACEGFCNLLPVLIIDHDFYENEKKAPAKDVASLCASKLQLLMHVLEEYFPSLPLLQKTAKK